MALPVPDLFTPASNVCRDVAGEPKSSPQATYPVKRPLRLDRVTVRRRKPQKGPADRRADFRAQSYSKYYHKDYNVCSNNCWDYAADLYEAVTSGN